MDSRRQLSALQPISDDSGGSNNGGGVVQVTGSGSREKGPAAVAKPPPLSTERITRRGTHVTLHHFPETLHPKP